MSGEGGGAADREGALALFLRIITTLALCFVFVLAYIAVMDRLIEDKTGWAGLLSVLGAAPWGYVSSRFVACPLADWATRSSK